MLQCPPNLWLLGARDHTGIANLARIGRRCVEQVERRGGQLKHQRLVVLNLRQKLHNRSAPLIIEVGEQLVVELVHHGVVEAEHIVDLGKDATELQRRAEWQPAIAQNVYRRDRDQPQQGLAHGATVDAGEWGSEMGRRDRHQTLDPRIGTRTVTRGRKRGGRHHGKAGVQASGRMPDEMHRAVIFNDLLNDL